MASKGKPNHRYTEEQKEWLKANVGTYRWTVLFKEFNKRFGTNLSYDAITSYCLKYMGVKRGKENQYGFQKGKQTSKHTLPIGAEMFDGMVMWIKVSDDCVEEQRIACRKSLNPNWRPKKQVVWEQHHGAVPEGMMLIHLNKKRQDCSIENLYLTTRKINFMMAKNGWYSENRELTLAALKWCELFYTLKGAKDLA